MTAKDKIRLTLRGFQTIHELMPDYFPFAAAKAVLEALLPFINIYMSGRIVTAVAQKVGWRELAILALITVILNFLTTLLLNLMTRIANAKSGNFWYIADLPLDRKIQTMDYEYVEDSQIHAKRSNITLKRTSMGRGLPRLYCWYFNTGIKGFFQLVFSIALVIGAFTAEPVRTGSAWDFVFSPWCTVLLILLFLLSLCWDVYNQAASTRKGNSIIEGFSGVSRVGQYYYGLLIDYKMGKDLKLYQMRDSILREFESFNSAINQMMSKWQRVEAWYQSLSTVNATVISGLIYLYVALKALFGAFGVGSIVTYVGSLTQFKNGFSALVAVLSDVFINAEALQEVFDFIDMPDKKYHGTLPVEKRAFCDGGDNEYEIEFRDVSFRYPGSEAYALRHVSIKFRVGERLAVVGMNGSGKTTFIKLLCRLYDPTEGEILLNGIDIRKYDYNEYLSIFSVVFQDFKLFSFSLGQNVAASVEVDEERAKSCLEKAGFGDRLQNLPKGLDTCLYKDFEEDGVEISGGEAQKIALARALYKNAPFIILDEPTAALDPVAEYEVYSKFNEIVGDKTAVYISHRLSSCRFCDNIVVFDNGQIVQRGSHDQLLTEQHGKYHELWYAQAQYYVSDTLK